MTVSVTTHMEPFAVHGTSRITITRLLAQGRVNYIWRGTSAELIRTYSILGLSALAVNAVPEDVPNETRSGTQTPKILSAVRNIEGISEQAR